MSGRRRQRSGAPRRLDAAELERAVAAISRHLTPDLADELATAPRDIPEQLARMLADGAPATLCAAAFARAVELYRAAVPVEQGEAIMAELGHHHAGRRRPD